MACKENAFNARCMYLMRDVGLVECDDGENYVNQRVLITHVPSKMDCKTK